MRNPANGEILDPAAGLRSLKLLREPCHITMNALLELVGGILLRLLIWMILFPVAWLVSTPIILVVAVFRQDPYWTAVADMYGSVTDFWKGWWWEFLP